MIDMLGATKVERCYGKERALEEYNAAKEKVAFFYGDQIDRTWTFEEIMGVLLVVSCNQRVPT